MAKEKKPFIDKFLKYTLMICGFMFLCAAVPFMPWRFSRVDTNCGNRFVTDRYYTLFGASNQFGKSTNWFTLKKKLQRKTEEFGRPSPVTAIFGSITTGLGVGGAAMGCAMWQVCKDHTSIRYQSYSAVAMSGMFSFLALLIATFACIGTIIYMGFEDSGKKKKKKKKSDDGLSPQGKTMCCCITSFLFGFAGVCVFMFHLDSVLKTFKDTAYYPYAMSHAGPYIGGLGAFLMFICMMCTIHRVTPLCGKKKEEEDWSQGGGYGEGAYGAYPPPPGAYGAYPPPGAYPQGQGW